MTSSLRPDDGEEDGDADDGNDNLYLAIEEKEWETRTKTNHHNLAGKYLIDCYDCWISTESFYTHSHIVTLSFTQS